MRELWQQATRRTEKGSGSMKELLKQIELVEQDMNKAQERAEYWLSAEPFNEDKVEEYEQKSDLLYDKLFNLVEKAADQIVRITSGRMDKQTARTMIRTKREELKRLFA